MSFFVSCVGGDCPCKESCGRYTHYTEKQYETDFYGRGMCNAEEDYVMQLTPKEVAANTMAKAKDGTVATKKTRKRKVRGNNG